MLKHIRHRVKMNVAKWVNAKTMCKNAYSAIHFACFQGDARLIRALHKYGADLHVATEKGISAMHIAAQ